VDFLAMKKIAVEAAQDCEDFAREYQYTANEKNISRIRRVLSEGKLVIMVIGEARTGKSSFLGGYLNDEILFPVDVDITTCLVTMVAYAEQEKITVVIEDETGQESARVITREQISDYAKEQNNPHGTRRAKMILIETPNDALQDGLIFVDTPGIGSMNPMHSQLTYQFLPRADVVLFVTDASSQISASELQFLKSVHRSCENILFLLTKRDVALDSGESILAQNRKAIWKEIGLPAEEQVHVSVSIKMLACYKKTNDPIDLEESNIAEFDRTLWGILSRRRASIVLLPRLLELQSELQDMEQDLIVSETAYSNNSEKIAALRTQLKDQIDARNHLLSDKANWMDDMRVEVTALGDDLTDSMNDFVFATNQYIEECLTQSSYKRDPMPLVNEVISRTEQQLRTMEELAEDTVTDIRESFLQISGMNLTGVERRLTLDISRDVKLTRRKGTERVLTGGSTITRHSFSMTAVGSVLGGVVGGVAGFFVAGPPGAMALGKAGATVGAAFGGATGTAVGTLKTVQNGTKYDPQAVRKTLESYVTKTKNKWELEKRRYISALTNELNKACRNAIQDALHKLEANQNQLALAEKISGADLKKKELRLTKERAAFDAVSEKVMATICAVNGESFHAALTVSSIPAKKGGDADGIISAESGLQAN